MQNKELWVWKLNKVIIHVIVELAKKCIFNVNIGGDLCFSWENLANDPLFFLLQYVGNTLECIVRKFYVILSARFFFITVNP